MVTIEIPYVRSVERVRGKNAYTYRRQVPADIRKALRCKNWIKTWRYGTLVSVVEIVARQLAATHDAKIARARGQATADMIQATEAEVQKLLKEDKREAYETLTGSLAGVASGDIHHRPST